MMKKLIKFWGIGSVMYFAVPLDMTAIEKELIIRWRMDIGCGRTGFNGRGPYCRCHSMGVDLENNAGSMIVNIGAQSNEFFHCYGRPYYHK